MMFYVLLYCAVVLCFWFYLCVFVACISFVCVCALFWWVAGWVSRPPPFSTFFERLLFRGMPVPSDAQERIASHNTNCKICQENPGMKVKRNPNKKP